MTTIHVKKKTWMKLNGLKKPGETMDDVIQKLLNSFEENQSNQDITDDLSQETFEKILDKFCSIANEEIPTMLLKSKEGFQKELTGEPQ